MVFEDGESLQYDYLRLPRARDWHSRKSRVPVQTGGHTRRCSVDHAEAAYEKYKQLLEDPGRGDRCDAICPASGPAYELRSSRTPTCASAR